MHSIAHVIHPVVVPPDSDLVAAQPVTFESMRVAQRCSISDAQVELLAVTYADESIDVPKGFKALACLERSVCDVEQFRRQRKLAVLDDILSRVCRNSRAEFVIYTNVDIAVQPYFYSVVSRLFDQGFDAFAINRRTLPEGLGGPDALPMMYAQAGEAHCGYDCFVFRKEAYSRFVMGNACIGTNWIGRVMLANLICTARQFAVFKDLHMTFHLGDSRVWQRPEYADYDSLNNEQVGDVIAHFRRLGQLPQHPLLQRFESDVARKRKMYRRLLGEPDVPEAGCVGAKTMTPIRRARAWVRALVGRGN